MELKLAERNDLIGTFSSEEKAKEALEKHKKFLETEHMSKSFREDKWVSSDGLHFRRGHRSVYVIKTELDPVIDYTR